MNNFFNNLLKRISPKKDEQRAKEEEDPSLENVLSFNLTKGNSIEILDKYVNGLKIDKVLIEK